MSVGYTARYDSGYVDGRVLLPAAHDVEAEALLGLGQLDDSRVSVALACGEGGDRCLCGCRRPYILRSLRSGSINNHDSINIHREATRLFIQNRWWPV